MSKAEKFIQLNTKKYSNETRVTIGRHNYLEIQPWLTPEQALTAVDIAREELVEWLEENLDKYIYITGEFARCKMFEDFRKAMEK
jgi:hypothetical protein